jgi:cold shock CspA family protein
MPNNSAAAAWAAFQNWRNDREEERATERGPETGIVRFFDIVRGMGFIDTGLGAVFLGSKVVDAAGIDPWPGDTVEFDRTPDPTHGRNDLAKYPRIVARAPRLRGTVKFYAEAGQRGSGRARFRPAR